MDTDGREQLIASNLNVALLLDTPGMRQFAVVSDTGQASGCADIEHLAQPCRFADCIHDTEPGCAVAEAVERGELLADRLASYHALQRDTQRLHAKHEALARHETRKKERAFGRLVREAMEIKNR